MIQPQMLRGHHDRFGASAHAKPEQDTRKSVLIAAFGGYELARFAFGSFEHAMDIAKQRLSPGFYSFREPHVALGLRKPHSRSDLIFVVSDGDKREIVDLRGSLNQIPSDVMLKALRTIGAPLSEKMAKDVDASFWLRKTHKIAWKDGAWETFDPQQMMILTMSRYCVSIDPAMSESVDVLVPMRSDKDLDHPDQWENYNAWGLLTQDAIAELERLGYPARSGFTEWAIVKGPVPALIYDGSFDSDIEACARRRGAHNADASDGPQL